MPAKLRPSRSPSPIHNGLPARRRTPFRPQSSNLAPGFYPNMSESPNEKVAQASPSHGDLAYDSDGDEPTKELLSGDRQNDVEAQKTGHRREPSSTASVAAEYGVATQTKLLYLAGYFTLNLSLTIYNKAVLGDFSYPWLLTTVHATCVSIGCYTLLMTGQFKLTKLNYQENLILVAYSFLFTINIAISNVSLAAVSVAFHQIMRSTCPVFTIIIYRIFYSRSYSNATYLSLIPIIFGVGLATYGDYYFTLNGFLLTLLGVVLASVKTVVTNRLMTGRLALPALEVLLRMSPLAALQGFTYAYISGETTSFVDAAVNARLPWTLALSVAGNGILAFVLNVSSLQTNKMAGALTLTVAGNMKQCLTILLGIVLFSVKVTVLNGAGMLVALIGAACYSKVELDSKGKKTVMGHRSNLSLERH